MNKSLFSGYLVYTPELRGKENYKHCFFKLGIPKKYKNKEGNYDSDFITIKAWNHIAERICSKCKKGDYITCEAHFESNSYIDESGNKHYNNEIIADAVNFKVNEKFIAEDKGENKELNDYGM